MADTKTSALNANTAPLGTDKLIILDDPGGSPELQIITMNKLFASCRVYNDADISVGNGAFEALTFNSEYFDTDGMHSTVSDTSRITLVTAGTYLVGGNVYFNANATGIRRIQIQLNGATVIAYSAMDIDSSTAHIMTVSTIYAFSANDYVELYAYQNSGGALDVKAATAYSPVFWAVRVA